MERPRLSLTQLVSIWKTYLFNPMASAQFFTPLLRLLIPLHSGLPYNLTTHSLPEVISDWKYPSMLHWLATWWGITTQIINIMGRKDNMQSLNSKYATQRDLLKNLYLTTNLGCCSPSCLSLLGWTTPEGNVLNIKYALKPRKSQFL